jgi:hypothetical protein
MDVHPPCSQGNLTGHGGREPLRGADRIQKRRGTRAVCMVRIDAYFPGAQLEILLGSRAFMPL